MKRRISADDAQIKLLSGLSEPSEEAAAKKQLAQSQKTLGSLQAMQRRDAADLAKLDAQIAECRKSSPGERPQAGNAAIAPFVGTWNNGMAGIYGQKYQITGHGNVLNYSIESSSESGGGECTVAGAVAKCRWHSQITESSYSVYVSGHSEMHLYGQRMNVMFVEDSASYNPSQCSYTDPTSCGLMHHPGAQHTQTWFRD